MRIAMIGQKGLPAIHGGVERHVEGLSKRLVQRGLKVVVYARKWYAPDMHKEIDGVQIRYAPTLHTKHLDTIIHTLFATIDAIRSNVDIIHYHGVGPSLLSWVPRVFAPHLRVVTTFHSIDRKHKKWNFFAKSMLMLGEWTACTFSHRTIAVSQTIKQYARDVYDCDADYIPNAVSIPNKATSTSEIRKWSLTPDKYILMVSRLIPHKGAQYLVAAWKLLKQKNPELLQGMKLVIVGDGYYTDTYVEKLHKQAEEDHDIIFMGFQSGETLHQLFSHARFMVHPSDNEGLPIVVLEGMSYGLPMLVSDIIEHRDLIPNKQHQFTAGSVRSLAKKLSLFIEADAETLCVDGERHKEMIRGEYEWTEIISHTVALYVDEQSRRNARIFATQ
jgi:glycosyltransferase involved in cell wall biosynthesis